MVGLASMVFERVDLILIHPGDTVENQYVCAPFTWNTMLYWCLLLYGHEMCNLWTTFLGIQQKLWFMSINASNIRCIEFLMIILNHFWLSWPTSKLDWAFGACWWNFRLSLSSLCTRRRKLSCSTNLWSFHVLRYS